MLLVFFECIGSRLSWRNVNASLWLANGEQWDENRGKAMHQKQKRKTPLPICIGKQNAPPSPFNTFEFRTALTKNKIKKNIQSNQFDSLTCRFWWRSSRWWDSGNAARAPDHPARCADCDPVHWDCLLRPPRDGLHFRIHWLRLRLPLPRPQPVTMPVSIVGHMLWRTTASTATSTATSSSARNIATESGCWIHGGQDVRCGHVSWKAKKEM